MSGRWAQEGNSIHDASCLDVHIIYKWLYLIVSPTLTTTFFSIFIASINSCCTELPRIAFFTLFPPSSLRWKGEALKDGREERVDTIRWQHRTWCRSTKKTRPRKGLRIKLHCLFAIIRIPSYTFTGQKRRHFGRGMDSWWEPWDNRSVSTCGPYTKEQYLGCSQGYDQPWYVKWSFRAGIQPSISMIIIKPGDTCRIYRTPSIRCFRCSV